MRALPLTAAQQDVLLRTYAHTPYVKADAAAAIAAELSVSKEVGIVS